MDSPCRDCLQRVPGIWRYGHERAFYVPSVVSTAQCPCLPLHRQRHVLLATIHRRKRSLHAERHRAWTADLVMAVHRHGSDRSQIERVRTTIVFARYATVCRCPHWWLPAASARECVLRICYSPRGDIGRPDWRCHQNSKCIETIRHVLGETRIIRGELITLRAWAASSCVALRKLTPLTLNNWSPRFNSPPASAGPPARMNDTKIPWPSSPPTMLKPRPVAPFCIVIERVSLWRKGNRILILAVKGMFFENM